MALLLSGLLLGTALYRAATAPGAPAGTKHTRDGSTVEVERGAPPEPAAGAFWEALAEERAARLRLEAEIAAMRLELDFLRTGEVGDVAARSGTTPAAGSATPDAGGATPRGTEAGAPEAAAGSDARRDSKDAGLRVFDESILLDEAGMPASEVERLRAAFQEVELEQLYLRDRARRERWGFRRLQLEGAELTSRTQALREEFGDASYDWYLYARGAENRVYVGDVLAQSPAADAGFETGDRVLRYDGSAVFDRRDLDRLSAAGELGESVRVEVDRGGDTVTLEIPRGSLGARVGSRSEKPAQRP